MPLVCRYCCKSLFALVIKNYPGCRRDFRVKMWGTSSPDDKLTGDLGNAIEATQIGGRQSDRLMAEKSSPSNFWSFATISANCELLRCNKSRAGVAIIYSITSSASASIVGGISRPRSLVVLRLMTNSNLMDCMTGKSAGFAPWRILPA